MPTRSIIPGEPREAAEGKLEATSEELDALDDALHGGSREAQRADAEVWDLLDAADIPILLLDGELRIRRFTRRAEAFFGLTAADVGRRITDIALPVRAPDLERWITQATDEVCLVEAEVQDRVDRWHRLQIRPHHVAGGRPGGTLLSLVKSMT